MPSSKIAGSYGGSIFSSSRNPHAVLKTSVLIYCPTHSVPGFPFLHTLLATDSVSVFALVSTVAIPHGARWQLVVALVSILLVMTDLEQFFFFPCAHLAISVSFWELPAWMYLCWVVLLWRKTYFVHSFPLSVWYWHKNRYTGQRNHREPQNGYRHLQSTDSQQKCPKTPIGKR